MAVRILDGAGNALTSTSAALDVNIKSSSGSQTIAGAVKVLDAGGTNQAAVSAAGAVKVDGSAVTQPVSIASSVPVTLSGDPQIQVSNFPATQPVNGTVAVSNLPSTQPVSGTVAISNFPATQPVSLATAPTTPVTGTFFQTTQPVSAASLPLPTGAATSANQTTPVVKGTQGTTAEPTQDLKDSGRTQIIFSTAQAGIVSVTTEALLAFNVVKGTVQTAAQTSYTVSAGKTLRVQFIRFKARFTTPSATATFANVQFNTRSAAAIATTNLFFTVQIDCAANAATPDVIIPIPDGWELPAGSVLAFSQLGSAATLTLSFEMKGYEY